MGYTEKLHNNPIIFYKNKHFHKDISKPLYFVYCNLFCFYNFIMGKILG